MIPISRQYIGIPFERMNCWQFVCHYFANELGIALPCFEGEYEDADDSPRIVRLYLRETASRIWPEVETPRYPDLAVFKIDGLITHAGIVLGDQRMLHTQRGCDSVVERYNSIRWSNRLYGFYRYQPQG